MSERENILFITGHLAAPALKRVVGGLALEQNFDFSIKDIGVSVAALMHAGLVERRLDSVAGFDRVILPGWCRGDIAALSTKYGVPFELGPRDLFDLPQYFGGAMRERPQLDEYDIEILAEINHAPHMTDKEIMSMAADFRAAGADVIDVGCVPGESWDRAGEVVRLLKQDGFRVSIDSFNRDEVDASVHAGAELVLSCRSDNVEWLSKLDVEVVVIPDDPRDWVSMMETVQKLQDAGRKFRIDPVLEPIGFGFAQSLQRYFDVRRAWPGTPMMMGVGNLTELTEVDSAGVNFVLAAVCQELDIHSVLTTQVINWARSSVAELDVARRQLRHSLQENVLPKHIDSRLSMLRDPRVRKTDPSEIQSLASEITDPNFRIFVAADQIHIMNRDGYWCGTDPFTVFHEAMAGCREDIDASHAFYLGYEFSKALTALTLGKQYTQDQALNWGMLTRPEISHQRQAEQGD